MKIVWVLLQTRRELNLIFVIEPLIQSLGTGLTKIKKSLCLATACERFSIILLRCLYMTLFKKLNRWLDKIKNIYTVRKKKRKRIAGKKCNLNWFRSHTARDKQLRLAWKTKTFPRRHNPRYEMSCET